MGKQILQPGDVVEISNSGHPFFGQRYTVESFLGSKYVHCKNDHGATFTFRISEVHAIEAVTSSSSKKSTKKVSKKGTSNAKTHTSRKKETSKGTKKTASKKKNAGKKKRS